MDCDHWSKAVLSLPVCEVRRFAYNATIDTLPTNANLALGIKARCWPSASSVVPPHRPSSMCTTSVRRNCASVGLNSRHDSVLSVIYNSIVNHIQESLVLADLPGQPYCFPVDIAVTDERTDIVIWNDHQCILVELTVPFVDNFTDAEFWTCHPYPD